MRNKIIAGNWKMNLLPEEASILHAAISQIPSENLVYLFPPSIYLQSLSALKTIKIGAQNAYPAESGAFTGEISFSQLKGLGVEACLIGHSERRAYFGEHDDFLKSKVDMALEVGITPFLCVGEPLSIREAGGHESFVATQIENALFHLDRTTVREVVIAYEPVWAIGTGVTASIEQAEAMHAHIRQMLVAKYDQETANSISILYGGSCNASNAEALFACPNVDGGLIGGASLDAKAFEAIINGLQ